MTPKTRDLVIDAGREGPESGALPTEVRVMAREAATQGESGLLTGALHLAADRAAAVAWRAGLRAERVAVVASLAAMAAGRHEAFLRATARADRDACWRAYVSLSAAAARLAVDPPIPAPVAVSEAEVARLLQRCRQRAAALDAVRGVLDLADSGEFATASRDYGRGAADMARRVRAALGGVADGE